MTVCSRHRRWSGDGTWEAILAGLQAGCDEDEGHGADSLAIDSTVSVGAHQHAAGARRRPPADIDPRRVAPAGERPGPHRGAESNHTNVPAAADEPDDPNEPGGRAVGVGRGW